MNESSQLRPEIIEAVADALATSIQDGCAVRHRPCPKYGVGRMRCIYSAENASQRYPGRYRILVCDQCGYRRRTMEVDAELLRG